MASFQLQRRNALQPRQLPTTSSLKSSQRVSSLTKRPRSPDHLEAHVLPSTKRVKSITLAHPPAAVQDNERDRRQTEREQREAEFRTKYKKEFPSWNFFFDHDHLERCNVAPLKQRIRELGGTVEDFFSSNITHVISDHPLPDKIKNKENHLAGTPNVGGLASPSRSVPSPLISKAQELNQKIWTSAKLESVTARCLIIPVKKPTTLSGPSTSRPQSTQQTLSRLLRTERIHGTIDRDPTQKRHDYEYFKRNTCFVLIEDIRQELATIAVHQYPAFKEKDKVTKTPWPTLHCHPCSRNPFAPFDEREKKRWERTQQEKLNEAERAKGKIKQQNMEALVLKRKAVNLKPGKGLLDLRRAVSMGNMRRQYDNLANDTVEGDRHDLEAPEEESIGALQASGFLASGSGMGYVAASGNSVSVTSATGTTSTSGQAFRKHIPAALQDRHHILTSLKTAPKGKSQLPGKTLMGPPPAIPARVATLKKSKSTNTLKLPKREEGAKPGYCESCRIKFSDFPDHLVSKKHRKFATDPSNFEALDFILNLLVRRPVTEVEEQTARVSEEHRQQPCDR